MNRLLREAAGQILHKFDIQIQPNLPQGVSEAQPEHESLVHRLTMHFLRQGAGTRLEIERFIGGVPRAHLPKLLHPVCTVCLHAYNGKMSRR